MKKLAIIVFIIFTIISCEKKKDPVEMIKDNDVENLALDAWLRIPPSATSADFELIRTTDEYASPTHSLKISKPTLDDSLAYFGQYFSENLPLNKKLTLSAKIKCVNLNGYGASLVLSCYDSPQSQTPIQFVSSQGQQLINGNTDWKEYSVTLDNLDSSVKEIFVFLAFLTNTTGTVYFDDIHLLYE